MKICITCKSELSAGAKFCYKCGKPQHKGEIVSENSIKSKDSQTFTLDKTSEPRQSSDIQKLLLKVGFPSLLGIILIFSLVSKYGDSPNQPSTSIAKNNKAQENTAPKESPESISIKAADQTALQTCTFNVNKIVYDLVFNQGRITPSVDIIGFYLQAKMQMHGLKLDQTKQSQLTSILVNGTGIYKESGKVLPLCIEDVQLNFIDSSGASAGSENYYVAYLVDKESGQFKSITPISSEDGEKLNNWFQDVSAKDIRPFGVSAELIKAYWVADDNCRGGSGDTPETQKACVNRHNLTKKLADKNWCYTTLRDEDPAYLQLWRHCK